MKQPDLHEKCFCCSDPKAPIWPITTLQEWVMEVCQCQAITEDWERHVTKELKARDLRVKQDKKRWEEQRIAREKYIHDQKADRMRNIRASMQVIQEGDDMANKLKQSKTGLLDSLILADIEAAYAEGAAAKIVAKVKKALPRESEKRLKGLFFSRRASLKAQAAKLPAHVEIKEPVAA